MAIKKNGMDTCIWIMLRCIILSERSQPERATYCVIQFTWSSGKDKTVRIEDKSLATKGWIERLTTKRSEGIFFFDGSLLYLDCHGGHTIVCICQNS